MFLLFIIGQIFGFSEFASAQICRDSGEGTHICVIQVKVRDELKNYKYEIRKAQGDAPTVILIPGGPGQSIVGTIKTTPAKFLIPSNYGVVLVDSRGTGINDFGKDLNKEIYSSELIAKDILEIIETERFNSYYILAGSYGTVVATHLGNLISKKNITKPRAIVLTAVVGRYLPDPLVGSNLQLQRLYSYYTGPQKNLILQKLKDIREKFGPNDYLFSWILNIGLSNNSESPNRKDSNSINVKSYFDQLSQGFSGESHPLGKMFSDQAARKIENWATGIFKSLYDYRDSSFSSYSMGEVIRCRELMPALTYPDLHFDFINGIFVSTFPECKALGYKPDRAFDSALYQIEGIPLIYVQGRLDTATRLDEALYHFHNQKNQQKVFLIMNQFSHKAFAGLKKCQESFWVSLSQGLLSFKKNLSQCVNEDAQFL